MAKDYYQILGLQKGASEEEIKKAFRALAHQHHPDKKGGDEAKFKEINEAYQVLGDSKKKAQYDQYGQTFDQGGPGFGGQGGFGGFQNGGFDMGDLGDMFDAFGFGGGGGRRRARGGDIQVSLKITFAEAAFGVEKDVELYKPVACSECSGTGIPPGAKMKKCETCGGQGRVRRIQRTILGNVETVGACSECDGTGNIPEQECKACGGQGVKRERRVLKIRVPGGIADGETIRVSNEGEAGPKGAPAGDLYLHVRVAEDRRFEREGFDVFTDLEIGFAEAALGTEKEVETLDGKLTVKVPGGVQSGEQIRLKGRGITRLQSSGRGDHYVRVKVVTPKHLSKNAKRLLEELKEEGV